MLGLIIRGLLAAAAVAAVTVMVVQYLDPDTAKEKIKESFGRDTLGAVIKERKKEGNVTRVTFEDLSSDQEMTIEAEEVDDSIQESTYIYV